MAHGNYPEHLVPDLYDQLTAFRVYHDLIYEYQLANSLKNLYYPTTANVLKALKMYYDEVKGGSKDGEKKSEEKSAPAAAPAAF